MVDIYRSDDFDELEAKRLGVEPVGPVDVVTKDVTPEQVEQTPAEVTGN